MPILIGDGVSFFDRLDKDALRYEVRR